MASAVEFYKQATNAFFEDDYDEALELYNKAIDLDATNPEYFLKRWNLFQYKSRIMIFLLINNLSN
jgi:suppressor of G2 allele of SKP1